MLRRPDMKEAEKTANKNSEAASFFTSLAPGSNPFISEEVCEETGSASPEKKSNSSFIKGFFKRLKGKK